MTLHLQTSQHISYKQQCFKGKESPHPTFATTSSQMRHIIHEDILWEISEKLLLQVAFFLTKMHEDDNAVFQNNLTSNKTVLLGGGLTLGKDSLYFSTRSIIEFRLFAGMCFGSIAAGLTSRVTADTSRSIIIFDTSLLGVKTLNNLNNLLN